jgi:hypothetical protein
MVSLSRISLVGSLLSLALLSTACGSSYKTTKVKDYKLALVQGEAFFKNDFRYLVDSFNRKAGMTVLEFVDSSDDGNSPIIMTKGLKARTSDNNVGFGQWLSESKSDNPMTVGIGSKPERTVTYTMRLEFDWDYFNDARGNDDPKAVYKKEKLFFHEVGHGLEMGHDESDEHSVMYPDVGRGDVKDFDAFFQRVRTYMNDLGD